MLVVGPGVVAGGVGECSLNGLPFLTVVPPHRGGLLNNLGKFVLSIGACVLKHN